MTGDCASSPSALDRVAKRAKLSSSAAQPASTFHATLLEKSNVADLTQHYAHSKPYKHAVVTQLFDRDFLARARSEIVEQINFREKETDIYKVK